MFFSAVKSAFFGLAAGIVLVVLLGRFGVFRRRKKVHNILAKLWYAYIPILFAVTFSAWFTISYARSMLFGIVETARPEITEASVALAEIVLDELGAESGSIEVEHVITLVGGQIDEYFGTSVMSRIAGKSGYIAKIANAVRPYAVNSLTDYIAKRLRSAAAGSLNLPEERIIEFWNTDILTALESGLVVDIILAQIEARIASAYKSVKIFFAVFALIPCAEIALSLRRRKIPPPIPA
ncbi:MAG: hypothetical protein LBG12_00265 [Synergistaceae bacterium]|jgi:hypothetical protein|nr:hypothetical protein [Synergistaceae bacterium]